MTFDIGKRHYLNLLTSVFSALTKTDVSTTTTETATTTQWTQCETVTYLLSNDVSLMSALLLQSLNVGVAGPLVVLVTVAVVWVGAQMTSISGQVASSPNQKAVSLRTVLQEVVEHMGFAKLKEIVQVIDEICKLLLDAYINK